MRVRLTVATVVVLAVVYAAFLGVRGVGLLRDGSVPAVLLGLAVLVVPVVGLYLVWREVEFGRRCAALAARLAAEGGLPPDDLPRRPSGRVDRAAADELFDRMRAEAEADPESWRAWFRLSLAYDAAGDRTRARAAARHAIEWGLVPGRVGPRVGGVCHYDAHAERRTGQLRHRHAGGGRPGAVRPVLPGAGLGAARGPRPGDHLVPHLR